MRGIPPDRDTPTPVADGGLPSRRKHALHRVEELGLRGEPDAALQRLTEVAGAVSAPEQHVAVAEHAMLLERLGGRHTVAQEICDRSLVRLRDAAARGRVLLARGRVRKGAARRRSRGGGRSFALPSPPRPSSSGLSSPCPCSLLLPARAPPRPWLFFWALG